MAEAEKQPCAEIIWKIENFTYCWQEKDERLTSSKFFVDCLDRTSWHLWLYPKGDDDIDDLGLCLTRAKQDEGDETVLVTYELAVLEDGNLPFVTRHTSNDCFSRNGFYGWNMVSRSDIIKNAEKLYPKNVLTVRCKMWHVDAEQPCRTIVVNLRTLIPVTQCLFEWSIDLAAADVSHQKKTINFPSLFGTEDNLQAKLSYVNHDIDGRVLKIFISGNALKEYSYKCDIQTAQANGDFFFKVSKIDPLPYDVICSTLFPLNPSVENSGKYLVGHTLPLSCEFSIISHEGKNYNTQFFLNSEHSSEWLPRVKGNYIDLPKSASANSNNEKPFSLLKTDILKMYQDALHSDLALQVDSQTFPVHANILSARSAVLNRMFDTDMKEKQEKFLKIDDLNGNTVKKMLDYIYTDSPGELDIESAVKLYYAGDKYELFDLKKMCSQYMMQNMTICNVFEVVMLAYRHNDEALKSSSIQFMFENEKEIVLSNQFKTFCKNNLQLGVEVMQNILERKFENHISSF